MAAQQQGAFRNALLLMTLWVSSTHVTTHMHCMYHALGVDWLVFVLACFPYPDMYLHTCTTVKVPNSPEHTVCSVQSRGGVSLLALSCHTTPAGVGAARVRGGGGGGIGGSGGCCC